MGFVRLRGCRSLSPAAQLFAICLYPRGTHGAHPHVFNRNRLPSARAYSACFRPTAAYLRVPRYCATCSHHRVYTSFEPKYSTSSNLAAEFFLGAFVAKLDRRGYSTVAVIKGGTRFYEFEHNITTVHRQDSSAVSCQFFRRNASMKSDFTPTICLVSAD